MTKPSFPPWFAWFLESKLRLSVFSTGELIERLPLAANAVVVEIGSGTGVYARAVRRHVGAMIALELQWPLIVTSTFQRPAAPHG